MAFNYNAGASNKDDVRLLIGDVDTNAQLDERLEDEDIARLLTLEGSVRRAAAMAADVLAAKLARKGEGAQQPGVKSSSRAQELRATASRLRASAAAFALPFAGGISKDAKETNEDDTDRVVSPFKVGMLDRPDAA